jgi:hypothetical protein
MYQCEKESTQKASLSKKGFLPFLAGFLMFFIHQFVPSGSTMPVGVKRSQRTRASGTRGQHPRAAVHERKTVAIL